MLRFLFSSRYSRKTVLESLASVLCLSLLPAPCFATTVQLSWDPVDDNTVAGYKIYCGPCWSDYNSEPDLTAQDLAQGACTLEGLPEGFEYVIVNTSFDAHGNESKFSSSVTFTVPYADSDNDGLIDADETGTYGTDLLCKSTLFSAVSMGRGILDIVDGLPGYAQLFCDLGLFVPHGQKLVHQELFGLQRSW